jgi:hypothetical protein
LYRETKFSLEVQQLSDPQIRILAAHALLIGVSSYASAPRLNVPVTAADARAVADVLRNPQFCGYTPERVTLLSDAGASRAGTLDALDALAAQAQADDTVFIFYAGHGSYGDDGYYLTTHDSHLANGKVVSGSGIREAELIDKLRAIKAKRMLLIVNACHSGAISPVLAPGEQPPTGDPLPPSVSAALLGTGEGRVIISACREGQYAYIGVGPLTLFTQALVDGLQGKGVGSNRGYISVFDLYNYLYFALDEAVPQLIPADARRRYGEKQEPELTILKGVGPFPVALWRGAAMLGDFDTSASPPEGTAVRTVNPAYSQAMLRQHQQQIGNNARVGVAVAGDVHGNIAHTVQRDVNFGSGNTIGSIGEVAVGDKIQGDNVMGDKVSGDKITTGNISGSGIAIGRSAQSTVRNVNTGGDYAEGNIDNRKGTFVSGDQFNVLSTFSGAILNIKSALNNVSQNIGAAPIGDPSSKARLQALIEQLSAELQKAPAEQAGEAEQAAKRAQSAVAEVTKPKPDKDDVEYSLTRLKKAAENIAQVVPTVLPIAVEIVAMLREMIGV